MYWFFNIVLFSNRNHYVKKKGFLLKKIMWEVWQGSDYFSGLYNFLVKSMCFPVTYVDVLFTYDTYFVFRLISKHEAADWINKSDLGRYW